MKKTIDIIKIMWLLFREGILLESYENWRAGRYQIDIFKTITYSVDDPTNWTSSVKYQEFSTEK